MDITFDPDKRQATLEHRGIDMASAGDVFAGHTITFEDDRIDCGEVRHITIGRLDGRMVVMVWTERDKSRRIISIRKANEREQKFYGPRLGGC